MRKLRQKFNLILTLALWLVAAQTAWAGTKIETRTATFYMDGGASGRTSKVDDWTLNSGGITLHYANNNPSTNKIGLLSDNQMTTFDTNVITNQGYIEFTNLEGTVKSVALTNMGFFNNMQMYVGLDKNDNLTLLHLAGNANDYDFPSIDTQELGNATFEGSVSVSSSSPLKIMFSSSGESSGFFCFINGTILITYEVEVEDTTDPGHTFTFAANASSDAITATCTEGSGHHTCGLTNRQVTMPLVANNAPYDHYKHDASLDMTAFNAAGITDIAATFSYKNANTNETLENAPIEIGNYTVTANVTVTYKETAHPFTLTKDFKIYNGTINCNYPQFSFSPKPAIADNNVTITFTPLAGETVTSLTLTGAMANMSLDNGITDNHNGTYTFTMVSESLTLDATFSAPDASNFAETGTDEYTIKTANGWNWFCYALNSGLVADGFSGKVVKLAGNVSSSEMAGMSSHPFKGTFDGQGNTLTFNLQASEGNSAPFHYTDGATISNLHVTGLIEGNDISSLAGLVGKATGNITISNCHVSTQISTTVNISAWHGGIIAFWDDSNVNCTITGCVYDGLIYNPNEANVTSYCFGFIGNSYGSNMDITFTDCLFAPAEYTNDKKALREDYGSRTFVYPKSGLIFHVTNCYYTRNLGRRQGRPATTATVAPANLGAATTDHGIVDGYENGFLYDGNYYTPKYGDVVVEYPFDDDEERASVTINGEGNNLVGVNITEDVEKVSNVTYNRTFTVGKASTVMLPFNYTCTGNEGGKFYSFAGFNGTTPIMEDGNQVTSLTANTPYLFVPTASTMTFPNIEHMTDGVTTLQPTTGDYDATSDDGAWKLVGSYNGKTWEENDPEIGKAYLIGDGGELIPVTAGTKIRPTECYIIQTAWATDKTLSGSESYEAQDGDVLTGSTSGTVTIANNAKITLSDVTITGGIVCAGTAEITLAGTNNVSGATYKAGIQIGGSGTTLTIKGNGSLTANGGENSAGIGLSRAWKVNATGGDIVIEGGNITATGDGMGAGIGTGVSYGNGTDNTATIGNITIKGGTVRAIGGTNNSYPGNGIGKGGAYSYGHAVVGTITIYDGIDMVDASSISESVTYMHVENETETDVTANASTYFTIIEDGNRRVIAPKDDNDYTITIANGIEHGTLTGAATAKYMEEVTITATPDFGYCLSRLVVKDAQNNDVESTDNSFFMPKSNITVSAVFEQGTHGTTEFEWFYQTGPNPEDIVLETIYDGVTTVNIQNRGMMYRIWKYEGNTYYRFLLDNNTGDANIPYAGGTGEFYESGNPTTNFVFPYDGETGYYDITMTDVGNGKWNVSILKTAGQMDVVPDQTYTGSAITPEPTVIAGSFNLTKGTDYVYSYTNNTNVGTAKVRATFQGTYAWLGYVEKEFTILPSTVIVNVTGNGTVTYNDKVATNGEVIGVVADKGTDVTLTLTPGNGYAVRSVAYGYTNNSGMTASGFKLPINGTTATLTVPNDLKDGTYVNLTVTFVSALVGGADEASAVALTDAMVTDLGGGWYKVDSDISFDHTLNLLGDTHLIIDDGKTMTVNTATSEGILSDYTLFVSGEGTLSVATTGDYGIAVCVGNYVQTGATVTASGYIGIRCTDDFIGFDFDNDFTFSGGQLTATGNSGGIWADNDITLSCTNATDFIQASSYSSGYGAVKIAEGNALTDGTEASNGMNGYSGTLTDEQRIAIGGKTLHRAVTTSYVDASGTLHENVIAIPLDNTMTTLAAGWYVVNENVDYTGKITLGDDVNIILADGKTMSVTNTGTGNEDFAIYGDSGSLHIYGQSQGTGALTATANSSVAIKLDDYITINGGTVTATSTSDVGIRVVDAVTINGGTVNATSIYSDGNVTINGGKVTATATSNSSIYSNNGTIILGLSNATDYITAESYNGAVKVADGQTLVDDGGNIYTGTLTSEQITAIAGKTLRPVMGVVLTKDGSGNISAEFNGTSLETVSIPVDITVNSVTLNRTFTYNKCATLMLPFSLGDGQSLNGGTLYKFDGVNNGEGDWVATLSEFTSPLKANTPYLIQPNGHMTDDKITFDLNGGTVTLNTTTAGEDSNEKDDLWDFIGTYSYIKWTSDTGDQDYSAEREAEIGKVYGFAAVEKTGIHVGDFVRVASGAKIRPMCAYLKWKGSIPNNARALTRSAAADEELPQRITVKLVSASGDITSIGEIDTTTGEVSFDGWYTLDGRKLNGKPSTKGLYINNGKKVVVK